MYRNVILHIVLWGCETWSAFRGKIIERCVQEWCSEEGIWAVISKGRKVHCEEHHNLFSSPNNPGMIKSMKVKWVVHVAWMGKRRGACRDLMGKPKGKGWIIFKWILKKKYGRFWTVLIGLRTGMNGELLRTLRS
jgi:hypothetical protein